MKNYSDVSKKIFYGFKALTASQKEIYIMVYRRRVHLRTCTIKGRFFGLPWPISLALRARLLAVLKRILKKNVAYSSFQDIAIWDETIFYGDGCDL